jgi:hypothetical protein
MTEPFLWVLGLGTILYYVVLILFLARRRSSAASGRGQRFNQVGWNERSASSPPYRSGVFSPGRSTRSVARRSLPLPVARFFVIVGGVLTVILISQLFK